MDNNVYIRTLKFAKNYSMEKRTCPECGEDFQGRSDKKFCSDLCRNAFNNKQNSDSTNLVRNINNILRKNRRILQELNPSDKAKVHKNKLMDKGYNFGYVTNVYQTKNGNTYHFCYEHGYMAIEDDYYILVVNKKLIDN